MSLSERHISDLRKVLAHLHDPVYLENHPLVQCIRPVSEAPVFSQGRLVSRILRLSIEALDPGPGVAPNAPEARPYHVLRRRYVARQDIVSIADQLGIGERQFYRELRRGLEALVHILNEYETRVNHRGDPSAEKRPSLVARVCAEVGRLTDAGQQAVDVVQLVAQAVQSAQPLARDWGIEIHWEPEETSLYVVVNRVMLRQVVLNLLSHIVRSHQDSSPVVRLSRSGPDALISISCHCQGVPDSLQPGQPYAVAAELLDSLGLVWTREGLENGAMRITIHVPLAKQHTILIVDDNVGLIRLLERYLNGYPCLVYGAANADEALSMIDDLRPDVVILDIMMPRRDGWEMLQALRQSEACARARVLVCSIINDPYLAEALGADGFLHKPVDRTSLLQVLDELISPAV